TPLDGDEVRLMPLDTETELLKKLEKFENDNEFLNNNLSLALLSANLNTNTKYLSHIINKHKKKDFSSYINELRILYIVQKIKKDPNYHNYKISYLASECGFSSHSKFATVFRNTTGLTPSSFLHTERSKLVTPQGYTFKSQSIYREIKDSDFKVFPRKDPDFSTGADLCL